MKKAPERRPAGPLPAGAPGGWLLRVPASTSNLGPGFDLVGLALALHLEVRAERDLPATSPPVFEREGEARAWPDGGEDLFARALRSRAPEDALAGWRFRVRSEIPVARGLGSSGAAVAAGLLAGRAVAGAQEPPDDEERLALLAEGLALEGHPENVSASLFGGCTLTLPREGGAPLVLRQPVHASLAFAVAWPDVRLDTARARAVLPPVVPHAEAVEGARRLAFLLRGLAEGRADLLRAGERDRLHVPYRLPLLSGAERALGAAREAGAFLATLSGSGSALLAIVGHDLAPRVARAMADVLRAATGAGTGRVLPVEERPPW